jgi:mannitol 2-dehydrogenase
LAREAIPTLREIPGHPPADYAESLFDRLANTGLRDQIARLCVDGSSKFPSFLLPTIEAQLDREGPISCAALALAGWARYLATAPAADRAPDTYGEEAAALARCALTDPVAFLELSIFGECIRTSNRFRNAFESASRQLAELGPLGAIASLLSGDRTQP